MTLRIYAIFMSGIFTNASAPEQNRNPGPLMHTNVVKLKVIFSVSGKFLIFQALLTLISQKIGQSILILQCVNLQIFPHDISQKFRQINLFTFDEKCCSGGKFPHRDLAAALVPYLCVLDFALGDHFTAQLDNKNFFSDLQINSVKLSG